MKTLKANSSGMLVDVAPKILSRLFLRSADSHHEKGHPGSYADCDRETCELDKMLIAEAEEVIANAEGWK